MKKAIVLGFAALTLLAMLPAQAGNHCTTTRVDLHIKKNELKVTPVKAKCVLPGTSFTIFIKPQGAAEAGAVTVEEKEGVPLEIRGDNSDNADEVLVRVDGIGDPQKDYGYIVRVSGHGVLDPEVRVVGSRLFMLNTVLFETDAILEEEMGFGLQELTEIQQEYEDLQRQSK